MFDMLFLHLGSTQRSCKVDAC